MLQQGFKALMPPATRTLPFASKLAVCCERAVPSEPVWLHCCARAGMALVGKHTRSVAPKSDARLGHARVVKLDDERE